MSNPELRAVLTEALSRSYYRIVGSSSDCRVDPGEILADALLSLPGVAVIAHHTKPQDQTSQGGIMNDPAAEAVQRAWREASHGQHGDLPSSEKVSAMLIAAAREALKPIQQWYLDQNSKWPQLRELIFPDGDIDKEYP
ncbi:HNH protein [Mycobacterium phage Nova]|uniref:HNH protein n=1 Tax=Mycobacterium phage Nova TaxID=1089130 RepID=G8IAU3_9CAUD|nr:HNH protein [Mycobacterium phage Nova]